MKQTKWFSRTFDFSNEQNIFPSIIERLSGTSVRLKVKMKGISPEFHSIRLENTWSIAENIGHLTDLETLWQGRLDDILNGETTMRLTDLNNSQTTNANHNAKSVKTLIKNFEKVRLKTLEKLSTLKENDVFKTALHPRLLTPMRVMDLFTFVAEHDDHHLARITEIHRILNKN